MNTTKTILLCAAAAAMAGCAEPADAPKEAPLPGTACETPPESPEPPHEAGPLAPLPGVACEAPPESPERLHEAGPLALFAGLTEADATWNEAQRRADPETPMIRNSLFLRVRKEDGTEVWRQLLTTGSDWRIAEDSDGWRRDRAKDLRGCLFVMEALLHPDKRHVWMICDPHTYTYAVLCIYDWRENTLRVVADGHSLTLEPDGSILVKGRKTYLYDDNGDSLGAAWFDEWRAPDGTVLRKTEPTPNPDTP